METEITEDVGRINMADRIELRRFVGRELLLWIWMESELFDATLSTTEHGSFGLWVEGRLVLDEGKESTTIKGTTPGQHREAKESLLRGKMPERAGLHLSFGDKDCTLTLRGETLAFGALVPPAKEKEERSAMAVIAGAPPPKKRKKSADAGPSGGSGDGGFHEALCDRMHFAGEVEAVVTSLYRDFLRLRLSPAWDKDVVPALERWVAGQDVDVDRYRRARDRAVGKKAS